MNQADLENLEDRYNYLAERFIVALKNKNEKIIKYAEQFMRDLDKQLAKYEV